jgi:predicted enzyme related to lactoylglutathione lyase
MIESAPNAFMNAAGSTAEMSSMPDSVVHFAAYFQDSEGNVIGLWETKS